jgi:hypothetical protein
MKIEIEYNTEPLEWGLALYACFIMAIVLFMIVRRLVKGRWD